ncbi:acyltransferase domain-containing protein [Cystobacter fuscus]|uniref:acyltransferase domain-containing protein n=1 Tax=Cystobacter fuscus TaxID=43 RepID=UPI002B29AF42|nr:acyltransferase domain-containing protein [Cystobacter fuscus]
MKKPTVFMYSGQGSQYYHMTRELYEQNPRFRLWMEHCDDIASPVLGKSLLETIFDPRVKKSDSFDSLADSNAALLCVEYSLTRLVQEMGYQADFLLGYSLGEITAAVVAEVFSLELGLTFAVEFARLLEKQTPRSSMLAVVSPLELLRTRASLFAKCWVTGTNFDGNFVVSGRVGDMEELQRVLERENILCQRLPVNYGVHTELIDPVKEQCLRLLGTLSFSPPQIPLISSVSTGRVDAMSAERIWSAMRMPVEFFQTVEKMLAQGDAVFIDLGPSATLATFVKYILPPNSHSTQISTINRFGNDLKTMKEFQAQTACL